MRVTLAVAAKRQAHFAKRMALAKALSAAVTHPAWKHSRRRYLAYTAILQVGF